MTTKISALPANQQIAWASSGTATVSTPLFDGAQTWNAGGVTFTGLKFNATDTASASGSLLMDLQVGGSSKFSVRKDGLATLSGGLTSAGSIIGGNNIEIPGSSVYQIGYSSGGNGRVQLSSGSNGSLTIGDGTTSGPIRVNYGGTTSSFPAIKRSSATLAFRLADDSADAAITALSITTSTAATFHTTSVALTNGAGASTGTLTNAPAVGNPTKWIGINDNGTTRYIPAW